MATTPLSQAVLAGMDPKIYRSLSDISQGDALLQAGMDGSPTSKWGAVGRLASALSGSLISNSSTSELAKTIAGGKRSYADELAAQLARSQSPVPSAAPALTPNATVQPASPGKIYSNDEPSPLDPPSGADRSRMVATILGEAGNEPQLGKDAVASVIRTRAVDGGYGGDTPSAVVIAPNQFEPWNTAEGRARMERAAADPKQAAAAEAAIASAYGEGGRAPNDPTEGMTHFYSPGAQEALGRSPPTWAGGESVKIGGHVFNSPDDPGALPTAAQPTQGFVIPSQQPQAGELDVNHLLALMQHPYADDASKALLSKLLVQKLTPTEAPTGFEKSPDGSGLRPIAGGPASPEYIRKKDEATGAPEFKEITNPDGSKRGVWIDAKNQTVTPVAGQATPNPSAGLQGKELLDELKQTDPNLHSQVQAVLENRAPYPTGSRLNPQQQRLKELVTMADPNFNAQEYAARGKLLSSFRAGKDADEIKALNTVSGHLNDLSKAATELGNTNFPMVNSVVNWARENSGDPRMNRFGTALHGVVDELSKAYRGGVISDAEARGWSENINAAKSPAQLHGVIGQMADMLQSKIQASKGKYEGMGEHAPPIQTVNPHAQEAFDRLPKLYDEIRARGRGEKPMADTAAATPSAAAAAPITVSTKQEYDALPSGASYIAPDGSPRTKK